VVVGEGVSASNGSGNGDDNTGGGETDIERRISIITICRCVCAGINCRQNCSTGRWSARRAIILVGKEGGRFWGAD
jgi:hypothetical protein